MKRFGVILVLVLIVRDSSQTCQEINPTSEPTHYDVHKIVNVLLKQEDPTFQDITKDLDADQILADYNKGEKNEDVQLYNIDLIQKYGFKAENYTVQTEDGYLLALHRIPNIGPVVMLNHGIMGSSDDWLLGGPQKALAFILASHGYDVWLVNARGNKYSNQHTNLTTDCEEFWDFSFDEMGQYDLPATIDYILESTDQEKLSYIGYCQGTTAFFVLCSNLPEYNDKIQLMVAMSPVAWVTNIGSPILQVASNENLDYFLRRAIGTYEVKPKDVFINEASKSMCADSPLAQIYCSNFDFLLIGFCRNHLDVKDLPVYHSHYPAGTSMKLLTHFAQEVDSGQFRGFDYDESKNFNLYDFLIPSSYRVQNITAPVAIFYSNNDVMANVTDVETLKENLPNVVEYKLVQDYCYVDFKWGANAKNDVYARILELLKEYSE